MAKYSVEAYNSGSGFFIHGGSVGDTFIKDKIDAELFVNALNMCEALKLRSTLRKVSEAVHALQQFEENLIIK